MRDFADQITWVAVADGQKALIFVNDDTPDQPLLNVISKEVIDNPPTREQGANRPGRLHDSGSGGVHRSAVDDTDWHTFEKERFAKEFAATLNKAALGNAFDHLVLFAPPKALGQLRKELHKETQERLQFTMDKDLTNHPVDEIERHVAKAFKDDAAAPKLI